MKLTLQIQLLPDTGTAQKLKATIERFNEAANWLAQKAFERKLSNKFALQKLYYSKLRKLFGLSAQMAIRCIAQAVEAYKRDKSVQPSFRKPQRAKLSGWSFFQLRTFIEYKAKRAGIRVEPVDPKYTSQACAECGHCEKSNRQTQASFLCKVCGHKDHADRNAARNIRAKALCQQA